MNKKMNKKTNKKMNKQMNKIMTIGLSLLLMIALIGIPQASAQFPYLGSFNGQYGTAGTKLDTCNTCHAANFARNPYGAAYGNNGHSFTAIESMDSDGDGFSNIVEIKARTFPGDPTDKPTPPPDTTPPVITVIGQNPVNINVGDTYVDAGATATDNVDPIVNVVTSGTVDTAIVGTYTLTYSAQDAAGNVAIPKTRTVNVNAIIPPPDTTPPVITLVGSNPVEILVGSTYVDAGATARDNIDGVITASIVTGGLPIDTSVPGSHIVTYNVKDSSGNAATQVTRTVNVVDKTPPVITLLGSNLVQVVVGSTYIDAGATARDNIDGDITTSIVTVNPVNTAIKGTYTVTYNVKDSSGNAATQVTRTVNVVDTVPPVITLLGNALVTVNVGSAYTDAGATALDNADGDITASIVTNGLPIDTSVSGSHIVTYNVKDSSGNAATQVTRTVSVVDLPPVGDTVPPVITLVGSNPVEILVGSTYVDAGATARDNMDGDITTSIVTRGLPIDTSITGSHTITYDVTDSSGNPATQVIRTVNVVDLPPVGDTVPPVITLLGSNLVQVVVGSTYIDAGATALDNMDGDITTSIVTGGLPIDTSVTGNHVVTYNVKDSSGNVAIQVTRTVNVISNTPPEEEEEDDEHDDEEHREEEHRSSD